MTTRAIVLKAIRQKGMGRPGHRPGEAGICPIDVLLKPTWVERVGYRYDVILDGETIVCRSRDPEHDAARALLARGFRSKFRTIDFNTGRPRMIIDIVKAARLRVIERDDRGLIVRPYRPMSADTRTLLRPHTLHQGRVVSGPAITDTGQPFPANGGGGCAGGGQYPASESVRGGERSDDPASLQVDGRVRPHRSHQGRVIPEPAAPGTPERHKRAGGESAEVPRAIPSKVLAVDEA